MRRSAYINSKNKNITRSVIFNNIKWIGIDSCIKLRKLLNPHLN